MEDDKEKNVKFDYSRNILSKYVVYKNKLFPVLITDALAERLRRWPAKPLYIVLVGSNPTGVVFLLFFSHFFVVPLLLD